MEKGQEGREWEVHLLYEGVYVLQAVLHRWAPHLLHLILPQPHLNSCYLSHF